MNSQANQADRKYVVCDTQTCVKLSWHNTCKAAQAKADRLDRKYGAVRYVVLMSDLISPIKG